MTCDRKGKRFECIVPFGILVLASALAVGCGDDGSSGAGDGGADDAGMTTGDGGNGGGDASAMEQCVMNQPEADFDGTGFTEACGQCACECNTEIFSNCGRNCWGLVQCVAVECADASNQQSCAFDSCNQYIGGASGAMAVNSAMSDDMMDCLREVCGPTDCAEFFAGLAMGDGDAGAGGSSDGGS